MYAKFSILLLGFSLMLSPASATSFNVPDELGKDGISDSFISKAGKYEQKFHRVESFFWDNVFVELGENRELTLSLKNPANINLDGKYNDYFLDALSFGTPDRVRTDKNGDLIEARYDVKFGTNLQTLGEENAKFGLGVRGEFNDFNLIATGHNTAKLSFDKRMEMYVLDLNLKITTLRPYADGSEPRAHAFGRVSIPLQMFMEPVSPPPGTDVPEPISMMLLGSGLAGAGFLRKKKSA